VGLGLARLGAVDVGEPGAVDDRVGTVLGDPRLHRGGIGHVERSAPVGADLVAGGAGRDDDVAAEHALGSGDQQLHAMAYRMPISQLSPTMKR
jgi:hypothetical protein